MERIVVDASVVLKWYLPDEEYSKEALSLLNNYVLSEIDILAPSLLQYEVFNGLIIAQRRGRIKEEHAATAIEGFVDLEITERSIPYFYSKIVNYCKKYNRSVYDASYLAVADKEGIYLITADEGLFNAVKKDFKWVKWIGEADKGNGS